MGVPLNFITGALALGASARPAASNNCCSLTDTLNIPGAKINTAELVSAGTTVSIPDVDSSCGHGSQTLSSDICRVSLYYPTSNHSGFDMEA